MNQRLWSGLTAALIVTTVTNAASSHAEPSQGVSHKVSSTSQNSGDSSEFSAQSPTTATPTPVSEVVKVGEYQTSDSGSTSPSLQSNSADAPTTLCTNSMTVCSSRVDAAEPIAKIHAHESGGRTAATLYVRNIPILTFLGSPSVTPTSIKVGEVETSPSAATRAAVSTSKTQQPEALAKTNDPVWRASAIAARINQLYRENLDASTIRVKWQGNQSSASTSQDKQTQLESSVTGDRYIIQVADQELVIINAETRLPDTTNNPSEDALQAANRLRRLLGNAPPLREVDGKPAPVLNRLLGTNSSETAFNPTVQTIARYNGWASWYGPGFHGNRTANGEVFNQHELTAAHRNLPFGTLIRVTNLDNNLSVVVRINDRGPFVGGRLIDLSAGAARAIGMIGTGIAPVRLEILGEQARLER